MVAPLIPIAMAAGRFLLQRGIGAAATRAAPTVARKLGAGMLANTVAAAAPTVAKKTGDSLFKRAVTGMLGAGLAAGISDMFNVTGSDTNGTGIATIALDGMTGAAFGYAAGVAVKALGGNDQMAQVAGGVAGYLGGGITGAATGAGAATFTRESHVSAAQSFMKVAGMAEPARAIPDATAKITQNFPAARSALNMLGL